jgi:RNA polymerase sigma factor (sigma-70 family)
MHQRPLSNVLRRVQSDVAAWEMRGLPDAELLSRFVAERDEEAFAVLMHRHSGMVLGVCRRVVARIQDAEDACQATFLILARKASSIRKTESLGSWLHGVAYRVSLRLKSKAARQPRSNSSAGDPVQRDTAAAVTWQEAMQLLDEELDRLPATYRAPLVLCYLEGQTLDEGAKQLGWTLGAFRGRLERGREMLRKRLIRRGVEIPIVLFGLGSSSSFAGATAPPTLAAATVKAAILIAGG